MSNLMITHILYQLMGKFQIGSDNFRKILAVFISLMIFGLMYTVVKFTGMDIPNFTRNLVMLASIDLAGFGFLVWKQKDTPKNTPETNIEENKPIEELNNTPVEIPETNNIEETNVDVNAETDNVKEEANDNGENEEVNRLMAEIIEENKERKNEIEKEMAEST